MHMVNMLEAKSHLSRLVEAVEQGNESEIIIARNGVPAAKLVPIGHSTAGQRIGVAEGKFTVADDFDDDNDNIAVLFYGDDS
jgi:prevent-host-death family protein